GTARAGGCPRARRLGPPRPRRVGLRLRRARRGRTRARPARATPRRRRRAPARDPGRHARDTRRARRDRRSRDRTAGARPQRRAPPAGRRTRARPAGAAARRHVPARRRAPRPAHGARPLRPPREGLAAGGVVHVELTHPERLLGAALLLLLWWLARPPRPRRVVLTAHFGAWRRALTSVPRRRLRFRHLRFWLLAIAALLAVSASGEPIVGRRDGPARLVVVLDGSDSMAARLPGGGTAWDAALARTRAEVEGLPGEVAV